MSDTKGPITLVTDLSNKRNRWKGLAFAWRSVAISAIPSCAACGAPAVWHTGDGRHWCDAHQDTARSETNSPLTRHPWYSALARALEVERQLEEGA